MLWRGCKIVRHCHLAIFASRTSNYLPLLSVPPRHPSTLAARWTAAVAFKTTPTLHYAQSSPSQGHKTIRDPRNGQMTKSKRRFWSVRNRHLSDVILQIEAMMSLRKSGKPSEDGGHKSNSRLLELMSDGDKLRKLSEQLVDAGEPLNACYVLHLAHHLNYTFKANIYETVAHRLAESSQWIAVLMLVSFRKQHVGTLTTRLLNWRARAYVETNNFRKLDTILDTFREENLKPTRRTYHLLISGHIRNRNLSHAKVYLTMMEEAGFPIDASTHALIVSVYRSLGPDKAVQEHALAALPHVDGHTGTVVLNSLIQMCLDARDFDAAWDYISMFGRHVSELSPPSKHGADSTPVSGNLEDGNVHGDISGPKSLPSIVLRPDIATFTMLLNYIGKDRDMPRALVMLDRMRELQLQPDGRFVAALIRLHVMMGDLVTATSLAASTCKDVPGARIRFHNLGLPITDEGRPDLLTQPVPPSVYTFNALLEGVHEKYGLRGTYIIFRIMRMAGVEPDTYTIEQIMSHLAKVGRARPRDLIRVLRTFSNAFVPTLRHVHIILSSVIQEEIDLVKCKGWIFKRKTWVRGPWGWVRSPNKTTSSDRLSTTSDNFDPFSGIELPRRLSYRALIRPILNILSRRRVRSDKATVALRLRHDGVVKADLDSANQTFLTLHDRGMHPNQYHYAAIMEGLVKAGRMNDAEEVLMQAIGEGLVPNSVLYTILISGYAECGDPKQAARIFRDMVDRRIRPDIASIDAMASAYFAAGAYVVARKVLLECWKYVGPVPEWAEEADLRRLAAKFRSNGPIRRWSGSLLRHKDKRRLRRQLALLLGAFLRGDIPAETAGQPKNANETPVPFITDTSAPQK